jgi:GH25 family lysozyme M1 (1,4-beta-N-acetylmuramidase)
VTFLGRPNLVDDYDVGCVVLDHFYHDIVLSISVWDHHSTGVSDGVMGNIRITLTAKAETTSESAQRVRENGWKKEGVSSS